MAGLAGAIFRRILGGGLDIPYYRNIFIREGRLPPSRYLGLVVEVVLVPSART